MSRLTGNSSGNAETAYAYGHHRAHAEILPGGTAFSPEIARELKECDMQLNVVFSKLHAANRTEAVAIALRKQLLRI